MKQDPHKFALIQGDDWEALYVNGCSVSQCHQHHALELLQLSETHGFTYSTLFTRCASAEDEEKACEVGNFPMRLSELASTLTDY